MGLSVLPMLVLTEHSKMLQAAHAVFPVPTPCCPANNAGTNDFVPNIVHRSGPAGDTFVTVRRAARTLPRRR